MIGAGVGTVTMLLAGFLTLAGPNGSLFPVIKVDIIFFIWGVKRVN